jgi:predicted homoserine dehydrogenase-like protein
VATRPIAKGDYLTYANCAPDERLKIVQVRRAQDALVRAANEERAEAVVQ